MTFILAVLAVAALVMARGASIRVRELRDRLDRVEDHLAGRAIIGGAAKPARAPADAPAAHVPAPADASAGTTPAAASQAAAPATAAADAPTASPPPASTSSTSAPRFPGAVPLPADDWFAAGKRVGAGLGQVDLVERVIAWAQEDWLMKLGALLLVLGFAWLGTYAFLNNWIGPAGRITIGMVGGAGFLALGWWRTARSVPQGAVLFGLGSSVILVTVLAARTKYGFFTPVSALGIMFVSAAFVSTASAVFRIRSLAIVGLVSGTLAPFMIGAPRQEPLLIFAYLFTIVLASLSVMVMIRWRLLTTLALAAVAVHSAVILIYVGQTHPDRYSLLLIAYGFGALFLWASTLTMLRWERDQHVLVDIATAAVNGLMLLAWTADLVTRESQSLVVALIALVIVGAAYVVERSTGRGAPFYIHGAVGVGLLGAATSLELEGATLGIALTLEIAAVIVLAHVLTHRQRVAEWTSYLLIIPGLIVLDALSASKWMRSLIHEEFFLVLTYTLTLFGLSALFRYRFAADALPKRSLLPAVLAGAGSVTAAAFIWQSADAIFDRAATAVMSALFVYTAVGLSFYIFGKLRDRVMFRWYGGVLLGFVVVRLLVVDVWQMELSGRIVTFFVIGAVLLASGFVGRAKVAAPLLLLALLPGATEAQQPDSATRGAMRAFRSVMDVPTVVTRVPTVLELPLGSLKLARGEFMVYDVTNAKPVPSEYRRRAEPVALVATSATPLSVGTVGALVDGDGATHAEFPVPDSGAGRAEIELRAARPIRSATMIVLLDRHVAYPTSVELRARVAGTWRVVVAARKVESMRIEFPPTTAQEWRLNFEHAQPLRITQITLVDETAPATATGTLRFLALPSHRYRVYLDADRAVDPPYGERGDLSRDQGVRQVALGAITASADYAASDADRDGVPDVTDNCVSVANADQTDVVANGRGDACDDFDRDGVPNGADNCPDVANRAQTDTDADGIGDVCDAEESRITEQFVWLPWLGMALVGGVLAWMFVSVVRRARAGTGTGT